MLHLRFWAARVTRFHELVGHSSRQDSAELSAVMRRLERGVESSSAFPGRALRTTEGVDYRDLLHRRVFMPTKGRNQRGFSVGVLRPAPPASGARRPGESHVQGRHRGGCNGPLRPGVRVVCKTRAERPQVAGVGRLSDHDQRGSLLGGARGGCAGSVKAGAQVAMELM